MKFLPKNYENKNLMPINVVYHQPNWNTGEGDVIDIIFKDMDTNVKYVYCIKEPEYEVRIVKPEYRDKSNFSRHYIEKKYTYPLKVTYSRRNYEIAKHLNIDKDMVRYNPYLYGYDIKIETFYLMQFILEYNNDKLKTLSVGFLDIESDIINIPDFPLPGQAPTNVVTYIDDERKKCYTLICTKCNLEPVSENNPNYEYVNSMRQSFLNGVEYFKNHLDEFNKSLHDDFDESYGHFDYHILLFEDEMEMEAVLFEIIRRSDNDFIQIWNSPYDMQNLIERPRVCGIDPTLIICDKDFSYPVCEFIEDTNKIAHKRKHVCITSTKPVFVCQMRNYAGIRSGLGKLPSLKLTEIAKIEINDSKLDYSEYANIKVFPYLDFTKFVRYNIKDVLLQVGIHRKTKDINNIYMRCYQNALLPEEVFTTTALIANSFNMFLQRHDYVMGLNKNKLIDASMINISSASGRHAVEEILEDNEFGDPDEDIFESEDSFVLGGADLEDESGEDYMIQFAAEAKRQQELKVELKKQEEEEYKKTGKKPPKKKDKQYTGAMVLDPHHMLPSGHNLQGELAKYIHDFLIDMDITSEYPTAIIIMNLSGETFVGKVILSDDSFVDIPVYLNFDFSPEELANYKQNKSNFMIELVSQEEFLILCEMYCNMPSADSILTDMENIIDTLL